jgi:predicted PurR-regulated permease PerM
VDWSNEMAENAAKPLNHKGPSAADPGKASGGISGDLADKVEKGSPPTGTEPPQPPAGPSQTLAKAPETIRRSMPLALSLTIGLLLAVFVGWLFYELTWFFLLLYLSFVLATIVEAPVIYLKNRGVPRTLATVLILLGAVGILGGIGYLLAASVNHQLAAGADEMKKVPARVESLVEGVKHRFPGIGEYMGTFDFGSSLQSMMPSVATAWNRLLSGFEVMTYIVVSFFMVMYMVIEGPDHLKDARRLLPRSARLDATNLFSAITQAHRGWFLAATGNVISSSTLTAIGLSILGVRGGVVLGVLAGLGELIPNVGPVLFALPAIAVAVIMRPEMLVWVLVMFGVVMTIQGYTISPLMMKVGVRLPVLVTIISVVVMGALFGVLGVLVAIPLSADLVVVWNFVNSKLEKDTTDYDSTNPPQGETRDPVPVEPANKARKRPASRFRRGTKETQEPAAGAEGGAI